MKSPRTHYHEAERMLNEAELIMGSDYVADDKSPGERQVAYEVAMAGFAGALVHATLAVAPEWVR